RDLGTLPQTGDRPARPAPVLRQLRDRSRRARPRRPTTGRRARKERRRVTDEKRQIIRRPPLTDPVMEGLEMLAAQVRRSREHLEGQIAEATSRRARA